MKKLLISLLLFAGMMQTAWAQITVTTASELLESVKTSQAVKLGTDITTASEGGRLDINNGIDVTLDLNGHTLTRQMTSAGDGGQVLFVANGGSLTINDSSDDASGQITGGWAYQGAGIYVQEGGTLTINGGTITGNRADTKDGAYGYGGGVENHGTLTITGGKITGNTAGQFGGGIHNEGSLTMTGGTITDNTAGTFGGGLYSNSTVSISGATLSGNTAQSGGGAICTEGTLTLDGVTITGNSAQNGGGIYMFGTGTVQLKGESAITGNTAQTGGGILQVSNGAGVAGPTLKMQDKPVVQDNTTDNVHLQSYQLITLTGAFSEGAKVGVCCEDPGQKTFTIGYSEHNGGTDPSTYFFVNSSTVNAIATKEGQEVGITVQGYNYVECSWDGGKVTETEKNLSLSWQTVHVLSGDNTASGEWLPLEGGHYYIVTANAEYTALQVQNCLNTSGAHLILCNGTQLKVNNGVKVEAGNTLHIHGQPGNTGQLIATNEEYEGAAIGGGTEGGTSGDIIIHGGTITASGGKYGAGIGGADQGNAGNITIYGGTITATGGTDAAGIGSGDECDATSAGNITIYGGIVTAKGSSYSAGIGGGDEGAGATTRIYGGDVTATGGEGGSGIGSGRTENNKYSGNLSWGDIAIYGGTVRAYGGNKVNTGAGIGGGAFCTKGYVTIAGGTVYAEGYNGCEGIGIGHSQGGYAYASEGLITISGGTVYSTSSGAGAIGGESGIQVAITGGEIRTYFSRNKAPVAVKNSSLFTLADNMTVYIGDNESEAQQQDANGRVAALIETYAFWSQGFALIKPCDHASKTVSGFDDECHYYSCSYCLTTPEHNSEAHQVNSSGICAICGKGVEWTLYDTQNNSTALEDYDGKPAAKVTLSGRTLYKDGRWNTLCLPFDVNINDGPLAGATAKYLSNATFDNGTLTLTFTDVASYSFGGNTYTVLQAGVPYFIKWTTTGEPIENPVFSACQFASTEPTDITFDGVLTFRGIYDPLSISSENKTMLYLGGDNKLYYPNDAMTIGAFRAYFQLADGLKAGEPTSVEQGISQFVLNFGDGEQATGISLSSLLSPRSSNEGTWHSLDGRRLTGKPTQKGIYINNGNKIVIE